VFYGVSDKVVITPMFEYVRDVRVTFSETLDDAADLDAHVTRLGIGASVFPDIDNLVLVTFEYRRGEEDLLGRGALFADYRQQEGEWYSLHGRVGVESRILAWLTLRLGVEYRRNDEESLLLRPVEGAPDVWNARHDVYVETPLNIGLGMHFGAFTADFVVNDGAPFGLGYAFTGAGRSDSVTFTSITLSYGW
jgi:hypothetical protein